MIGSTSLNNRSSDSFGKGKRRRSLSRQWCGSLRHASIKTLPDVFNHDTEQLAHTKRQAEFWLLTEPERGQ